MLDFYEIMDFCGFDLQKANTITKAYAPWMKEAVEETLNNVGLEALQSESVTS